ncbi:glycerophosphodiester phosphodiesterase [Bartonella sp. HY406]|uniref:glycerophosphodiester phosphodiesterase n=1 Tax=Bartonella sp. HY406 TaxID=2979331 RepID=UPI0021C763BF|nr:glycerophosphodiester phosphodiesterase family protein [Bartonella sp. HY406]UXN02910.1 glycerophosphodiester phosphodiesterase family protein [Bartonella sp. HY406]
MHKPKITAHRGGAALAPENSLSAFMNAIVLGADEVECDVHLLKSGEVVVFHDFHLEQLAGRSGDISELNNDERKALRISGGHEAPPLLEDVLEALAPSNLGLHIEIKTRGNKAEELVLAQKSLALIEAHKMGNRTSAISFDGDCLKPFIDAGVPSGSCVERMPEDFAAYFAACRNKGYRDLSFNGSATSVEFAKAAIDEGFQLGVWTINGPARLAHWLKQPVKYITTDQPDLALKMRKEICKAL